MMGSHQQHGSGWRPYRGNEDDSEGKLFVGGLAWNSDEDSIKRYFEDFGPVAAVNLKRNIEDPSKHRGFAFVKFLHCEDADKVLMHKEPHIIDGSKVDPKSACPIGVKPEQRTKKVFIGGLSFETTEEKLMEYFGEFGEIQNKIEFAVDHKTKKRRGFCFIEFASENIVDRIVRLRYHEVAGRTLETRRALTKQQQQMEAGMSGRSVPTGGLMTGNYGVPAAASPYAQPVIYIHPDSLSSGYPMSSLGFGYGGYISSLDSFYSPFCGSARDNARPALYPGYWRFYPPNPKSYPTKQS